MSSTSIQIAHSSSSIGMYEPTQSYNVWKDMQNGNSSSGAGPSSLVKVHGQLQNQAEYLSQSPVGLSDNDQQTSRFAEKIQRRLAQNREAARKSRLRKKAYVQQLEVSRLKLAQMEQELEKVKSNNQGLYVGSVVHANLRPVGSINTGVTAFEMRYAHWCEEQQRHSCELRNALRANASDVELRILVEGYLNHFYSLFQMKADLAKSDVFYLMSGTWRSSIERFFHWIGGFRPSELINVIMPRIEPLTEQQAADISKLKHSSQQAEYALSQGMEKLPQTLGQIMQTDGLRGQMYEEQMTSAMEQLDAIEGFVNQADHLRKQSLQLMSRVLTPNQAARGLLALGDYFHRLSALSSLWAACPRDTAA